MSFFKKLKNAILGRGSQIGEHQFELTDMESILIEADFGVNLASKISQKLAKTGKHSVENLRLELSKILDPLIMDFEIPSESRSKPFVIFLVGINGCGKTTTIAKLAHWLVKTRGFKVAIAACDTFRAAAVDQVSLWAERIGCDIFKAGNENRDASSVLFEAINTTDADILLVDTAGRLHNNHNLMDELAKMYRVAAKTCPGAPHMNVMIIDATTGQNAIMQAAAFGKAHPITGLIIAKMDGNSKGGTIIGISNELKIPILGIGTGESVSDFERFSIDKFLKGLVESNDEQ
jgi:fused signal recognition particle receptor